MENKKDNYVTCGMYSEVIITDNKLKFKANKNCAYDGFSFIKREFDLDSIEDEKIYETFRVQSASDVFLKRDNIIYFFHKIDGRDMKDNIYYTGYDLKIDLFFRIDPKEAIEIKRNTLVKFGNFTIVNINGDDINFNFECNTKMLDFSKEPFSYKIADLSEETEYSVAEHDGKRDCMTKLGNVIYFYSAEKEDAVGDGIICCSYNMETKRYEYKNNGLKMSLLRHPSCKLPPSRYYNTGIISEATVEGSNIVVNRLEGNKGISKYAMPLLKEGKIYTVNRISKLVDFIIKVNDKIHFGYGVIDDGFFQRKVKLVFDVKRNKFLKPSELSYEDSDLTSKITDDDFEYYISDKESENTLQLVLEHGIQSVTNEQGTKLILDLLDELENLYSNSKLFVDALYMECNLNTETDKTLLNTLMKRDFIKRYIELNRFTIK